MSAEQGLKAAPGVKQVAKGLLEQLVAHSIWVTWPTGRLVGWWFQMFLFFLNFHPDPLGEK